MRYRARIFWHLGWMILLSSIGVAILVRATRDLPGAKFIPPVMLVFFLMAAGAGARRIAWRLARPIEALADASRRFGAGDLGTRVTLPRPHPHRRAFDEIYALGRDWNEMAERIERLVHAQRELLANVSHELRSPLARIRVALELLPRTDEASARFDEVAADIEELDRLIDDVLTASRLEAAPSLRPTQVDLGELLDGVKNRAAHDPLLAAALLRVEADGAGTTEADGGLLRRALWNLVENAAKHGAPPITLRAAREDGELVLSVVDEGPGIPVDDRARAAQPFVRLDLARTPSARAGIGLGLTIARRVAEAHGGRLVLAAGPGGRGLAASLHLPFTLPSSDEQTAATSAPHVRG